MKLRSLINHPYLRTITTLFLFDAKYLIQGLHVEFTKNYK
jgi:hypothetical protein